MHKDFLLSVSQSRVVQSPCLIPTLPHALPSLLSSSLPSLSALYQLLFKIYPQRKHLNSAELLFSSLGFSHHACHHRRAYQKLCSHLSLVAHFPYQRGLTTWHLLYTALAMHMNVCTHTPTVSSRTDFFVTCSYEQREICRRGSRHHHLPTKLCGFDWIPGIKNTLI